MPAVRTEDRAVRTPPRLLVADDNPLNVDILRTRLTTQGYEVLTASDGEAALALARTEQPDLLLLDIMMPGLDGLEVCRRLKADPTLPFMPVILVTAKADSRDIVAGLDAGADEYLPKPVDQAALVARVKSMLRIKAAPETRHVPIIAVTAYAMKGDDAKALAAGCDAYVAKPIDTRALPRLVEELLARTTGLPRPPASGK